MTFGYKFARMNKTAYDVWYERKGVCRDFQHLAITLLRGTENSRPVCDGISGRHRRAGGRVADGFFGVDGSIPRRALVDVGCIATIRHGSGGF